MHILKTEQIIRAPIAEVWHFFSSPANLNQITPPDMRFEFESDPPDAMYAGQIIRYRIRIAPFIRLRWVTEIRQADKEKYFVDEQRFGPYRFWYHEHRFTDRGYNVLMHDTIHYLIGFGFIGRIAHWLWIRRRLEKIFEYRRTAVDRFFNSASGNTSL